MQIPDEAFWSALALMGGLTGWLVTLERRLNARLTRHEHAEICDGRNKVLEKKLDEIMNESKKQAEAAVQHRQWVGDSLGTIRTHVALIRDRMGDDPFRDTSDHIRREGRGQG